MRIRDMSSSWKLKYKHGEELYNNNILTKSTTLCGQQWESLTAATLRFTTL